jgi:hypothetical protein
MYKIAAGVDNDEWVSGGRRTLQRTAALPQLKSRAH